MPDYTMFWTEIVKQKIRDKASDLMRTEQSDNKIFMVLFDPKDDDDIIGFREIREDEKISVSESYGKPLSEWARIV